MIGERPTQNPYAVERFVQEHNAHARAVAELQALRRRAAGERRTRIGETLRSRLGRVARRPFNLRLARAGR